MSTPLIEYGRSGRALDDVPVFDMHTHIGSFPMTPSPDIELQVREMDRIGIDIACISAVEALHGDQPGGNDDVADVIRRYPDHFIGYCHVSAQFPDLMMPELERCFENPAFRGIKIYQVGTDYSHALFDPVWEFARTRGLPVMAHTWGGNLTGLDDAALRFPEVPFLPAHTGSGFAYQPYIDAARKAPNILLDLTYSREHTNMIEHFVEEVGAERLVWGTDAPCFSMAHQVGKILFARIPDEAKLKILHGNAAKLFGLTPPEAAD